MKYFDYDDFMHNANSKFLVHEGEQRYGQFLMNYLYEKHPEIYNQVPENIDPFYSNEKCGEFLKFLANLSDSLFRSRQCAT